MNDRRKSSGLGGDGPGIGALERDPHRGDLVSLRAQRVAFAASVVARVRAVGERLWMLPLVMLGLVVVDAALALPGWARATLGVMAVGMGVWIVLAFVWPGRAGRLSVLGAARLLEERLGLQDNALVNALQLRAALVSGDGVTAALAERVVDHGVDVVRASEGERVVNGRGAARAWGFVVGAVAVVAVSVPAMPRVWGAGVARYVDPFGDHPAWSATEFSVEVLPDEVLVGDDATVVVRLGGKIPESVELVFIDGDGAHIDRAEMGGVFNEASEGEEPARAREYRMTLHDLREPVRFYPASATGRGAAVEIPVLDKPRIEAATLVVRAPEYTGVAPISERVDLVERDMRRRVLLGSTVELSVGSSVEIGEVDRSGGTVTGDIDISGRTVMQRVVTDGAGEELLSIRPVSRSGLRADHAVRMRLEVVEDMPPLVTVRAPAGAGERAAVLEGTGIPVRAMAEDDVRVASLEAEWVVHRFGEGDGGGEGSVERAPLRVERPMRTRWDGQLMLDTGAMGARAGDEIELWVVGEDDRGEAFGGAQATRLGPILVSVIDQKEFKRRSLERMGIGDIVEPYEEIARGAEELARATQDAAEAAEQAAKGEASEQEAARAAQDAQAKHEALLGEVERRLASEPLVDFDESMHAALEQLHDRLGDFEAPTQSQEAAPEAAERAERNAELADLAAREAALDIKKPSERLRLAAEMRAELDRLDAIAKRQRALSDRLAGMGALDKAEATKIAAEQYGLMSETDDVCARLDALGDKAANEFPGSAALEGAELALAGARRGAQEAIEAARDAANASTSNLVDAMMRADMREAADLALTDLYFVSDPALDAIDEVSDAVKERGPRLDDPEVGRAAGDGGEKIRKALEAVGRIEEYLERVRERVTRESAGRSAQRNRRWSPAGLVGMLAMGVVGGNGEAPSGASLSVEDEFAQALQAARVRLGDLKARLREAQEAMSAPLPVMGGSAIELARQVNDAEIAATMYDAEWAMSEGDLTGAQERAALAADRLEALYESVTGGPSECKGTDDAPLRLLTGDPSGSSQSGSEQGSSGSSSGTAAGSAGQSPGSSSGGGGLPNALDVLSQSSGGQTSAGAGSGDERNGEKESGDRAGFKRAGSTPGSDGREGGEGEGSAKGQASKGDAGKDGQGSGDSAGEPRDGVGDPRLADRARRFNEKLYAEPIQTEKPIEGEGEGARTEADVIHIESDPVGRERALRGMLVRSGMSGAEVDAVFERVPPAYRDVVAAYLMRIARDEASSTKSGSKGSP